MIDLEQLRKDMEAGTQGDWDADVTHPSDGWNGWHIHQHLDDDYGQTVADVHGPQGGPTQEANARRIARLPDLERAYLELREAADALADIFENVACFKVEDRDKAMQALAAYRKATQ